MGDEMSNSGEVAALTSFLGGVLQEIEPRVWPVVEHLGIDLRFGASVTLTLDDGRARAERVIPWVNIAQARCASQYGRSNAQELLSQHHKYDV